MTFISTALHPEGCTEVEARTREHADATTESMRHVVVGHRAKLNTLDLRVIIRSALFVGAYFAGVARGSQFI